MPSLSPLVRRLVASVLLVAVAGGCDHTVEPEGPNLIDRFGPFQLVTPFDATVDQVDFAADESVVFTAEFNKQVEWTVTITGQESGAVKILEGFSRSLTADNARWRGTTTELPFFRQEAVVAVLTIPSEEGQVPEETTTTVEVLSARVYPGIVAADFQGNEDIFLGNFEFELDLSATGRSSEVPAAEGEQFYLLRSTGGPTVADAFFIGLIDITPDLGEPIFQVPTTVPEDLYFNFFVRGFGTPNGIAVIQLIADANGTGNYEADQDAVFAFGDIDASFTGWRGFSKTVGEMGMTQQQAGQIVAIRVVVISNNNAQPAVPLPVDFGVDYFTFTAGGPLRP